MAHTSLCQGLEGHRVSPAAYWPRIVSPPPTSHHPAMEPWCCPCGTQNWPERASCRCCSRQRSPTRDDFAAVVDDESAASMSCSIRKLAEKGQVGSVDSRRWQQEEPWRCPCGIQNWQWRQRCRRCKHEKDYILDDTWTILCAPRRPTLSQEGMLVLCDGNGRKDSQVMLYRKLGLIQDDLVDAKP